MHVTVVGAGVFGAWTALWLRRRGASVTLVDRYGAGNSLASSGGESRATRSAHGPDPSILDGSVARWASGCELDPHLFVETGVLWLARRDDGFEAASADSLDALGIPAERLSVADLGERWPQLRTDGLAFGLHEPEAGVLLARRAVAAVAAAVAAEGGETVIGIAGVDAQRATLDGRPVAAMPWCSRPVPGCQRCSGRYRTWRSECRGRRSSFSRRRRATAGSTPARCRHGSTTTPASTACPPSRAAASRSLPIGRDPRSTPIARIGASPTSVSMRHAPTSASDFPPWNISR